MIKTDWTIYEEDYWAISSVLKELLKNSNSESVLLIDKNGTADRQRRDEASIRSDEFCIALCG